MEPAILGIVAYLKVSFEIKKRMIILERVAFHGAAFSIKVVVFIHQKSPKNSPYQNVDTKNLPLWIASTHFAAMKLKFKMMPSIDYVLQKRLKELLPLEV